jgi:hypothetical protein
MRKIGKISQRNQRKKSLNTDDFPPLTLAQIKELKRRQNDYDNRKRYIIASRLWPRFNLYYNISGDYYSWNDPTGATLFKRLEAAIVIKRMMNKESLILTCRVDRHGKIVLRSIKRTLSDKTKQ